MFEVELKTRAGTRVVTWQFWQGQKLRGSRPCPLALDTETEPITDERKVPRLALAVAGDGKANVVIHPDRLGEFLLAHKDAHLVGHNVPFDFWVIDEHLAGRGEEAARRVLWDACDGGRLLDTQVLDMLLQLGTGQFRKAPGAARGRGKDGDTKVYPGNLAEVAAEYTTLHLDKEDPYRLRFGELVGLGERDWTRAEPGFFRYAVRDAFATHRLYPALADAAYRLMVDHGHDPRARRYDIRPDAIPRFGYLSEVVQVQASVVLAYLLRRGVRVDLDRARALEAAYRAEMAQIVATLETDYRDVLTYGKDGKLRLTPKGQTPALATTRLEPLLLKIAEDLKARGHDVQVPVSKGKTKGTSHSVKEWARYADLHPFLGLWARMTKLTKLLGFFSSLNAPVLHCQYSLLMRTGRTSCSRPRSEKLPGLNLQQMPRDKEFRALFVPDPGHVLFTGDFAAAELRTLAAVCKARYGFSNLGDVITRGVDPHAFTAAAVQGMSLEDFLKLKEADPARFKQARQAAKALNFGIPGGLGADSLVAYARANYGVTMTADEAAAFKAKLITETYPELSDRTGYLADDGMAALARNLGVKEREAWEVFDRSGQKNPIAARAVAKVVRGTSTASEYYITRIWDGLARLARTAPGLAPETAGMLAREEGGLRLHARLYRQSAATLTGRIRAGVGYTESKNTPFQSLCADGAKLALWRLLYAGFDVYGFIHDEILVQLPAQDAQQKAAEVARIMEGAMAEVMGHGIPAACEYGVAGCWAKP
jgi:hypothetical protein